jgi:AraC-like DNA-binding protein
MLRHPGLILYPDIPTPVTHESFETWNIKVVNRSMIDCSNYLSPNRRDFYKILFINDGSGIFSIGVNNYYIDQPTIPFLHPNEIITWKNLSGPSTGYYSLFKKRYVDAHPLLKAAIEKHQLFHNISNSIIHLNKDATNAIDNFFMQMHRQVEKGDALAEDAAQAYLQLIMVESAREANFPEPESVSNEYRHVHTFFQFLEQEASNINIDKPVRIKTAKEFADLLSVHPNHLNALLKRHTGQNISTHIKTRLLEESKALLLQTDWPLQNIGYCIGFADQANFTQFFKKSIGLTPRDFRKHYTERV